MNDRELLELAAKAAGEGIVFYGECWRAQTGREWNPLTDDGDALRLAVALQIDVNHGAKVVVAERVLMNIGCAEGFDDDPYAATRRAIVRAAAEIGKSLCDASIGRVE